MKEFKKKRIIVQNFDHYLNTRIKLRHTRVKVSKNGQVS